jgi:hypothetical protein
MLRRTAKSSFAATGAALGAFSATQRSLYKYQDFEMSRTANMPFMYPREAPNTSYFGQFAQGFWPFFGYGREELFCDRGERRYETSWHVLRKMLFTFYVVYYFFPWCGPIWACHIIWGEYGERPYLFQRRIFDDAVLDNGCSTIDAEWLRHIHSNTNM